jgi:hypothetical protein
MGGAVVVMEGRIRMSNEEFIESREAGEAATKW